MEARRRGYRERRAAPPERGQPLTNLTQPMSQTATEPSSAPALRHLPRRYLALGLIILAICLLGALVVVRDNTTPSTSSTTETLTPAPASLLTTVASVPASVFDTIGVSSPTVPVTPLHATPATSGGPAPSLWQTTANGGQQLPVVFFYGAEFAPFPAAERWPLVLALSRFGTFHQLVIVQSSPTTAFAGLSTFTLWQSRYTSHYVVLESVERYGTLNPTGAGYLHLEHPDGRQAAAVRAYGSGPGSFALLDVANRFVLNGSAFTPGTIVGLTQDQIAGNLSSPLSPLAQAVVASANEISAAICSVDGQQPTSVCTSKGVEAADDALKIKVLR